MACGHATPSNERSRADSLCARRSRRGRTHARTRTHRCTRARARQSLTRQRTSVRRCWLPLPRVPGPASRACTRTRLQPAATLCEPDARALLRGRIARSPGSCAGTTQVHTERASLCASLQQARGPSHAVRARLPSPGSSAPVRRTRAHGHDAARHPARRGVSTIISLDSGILAEPAVRHAARVPRPRASADASASHSTIESP